MDAVTDRAHCALLLPWRHLQILQVARGGEGWGEGETRAGRRARGGGGRVTRAGRSVRGGGGGGRGNASPTFFRVRDRGRGRVVLAGRCNVPDRRVLRIREYAVRRRIRQGRRRRR